MVWVNSTHLGRMKVKSRLLVHAHRQFQLLIHWTFVTALHVILINCSSRSQLYTWQNDGTASSFSFFVPTCLMTIAMVVAAPLDTIRFAMNFEHLYSITTFALFSNVVQLNIQKTFCFLLLLKCATTGRFPQESKCFVATQLSSGICTHAHIHVLHMSMRVCLAAR